VAQRIEHSPWPLARTQEIEQALADFRIDWPELRLLSILKDERKKRQDELDERRPR